MAQLFCKDRQYSVLSECRMGDSQPMTLSLSPGHSHSGWEITHPHVESDKEWDRCGWVPATWAKSKGSGPVLSDRRTMQCYIFNLTFLSCRIFFKVKIETGKISVILPPCNWYKTLLKRFFTFFFSNTTSLKSDLGLTQRAHLNWDWPHFKWPVATSHMGGPLSSRVQRMEWTVGWHNLKLDDIVDLGSNGMKDCVMRSIKREKTAWTKA